MRLICLLTHVRILCLCLLSGQVVSVLSGAPGDLDSTFGASGQVVTAVGSGDSGAHDVALQSDGKVVSVGYFNNGSDDDFAVARYNVDGTLDTTFNATGIVTADFGSSDDVASGCAVQSDGKIIVVGTASTAGIWRFALARFHPDGTPDTEFGVAGTGRITTAIGNPNASTKAEGVKIQPDGKILVGGSADLGYSSDFVVLRYNSDGTLDNSFGAGGLVSTNIFGYANHTDIAFDLALRANGQILVGGYSTGPLRDGYAVAVYNSDGTPDGNFGTGGTLFSEEELNHVSCVAWQGDGKILVGGSRGGGTGQDFCLRRYSAAGIVDTTFGNNGVVITPIGTAADVPYNLAVQSDGKIVAIGASYNANTGFDDFAVARYNEDGSLDVTFSGTGKVTTSFPGGSSIARGIVIGLDGRIVVAGYAHDGAKNNFALARYIGEGNLRTTSPAHHSHISSNLPMIEGRATPGLTINVYIDDAVVGSTVVDGSGDWSFLLTVPLLDGQHTAAATDGVAGPFSNIVSFTVDTLAPLAPTITSPSDTSLIRSRWPVISGTASAGEIITIYFDDVEQGTTAASNAGEWHFTPEVALDNGLHSVKATATDPADNTGPFSVPVSFSTLAALFGGPGNPDTTFGVGGQLVTAVGAGDSGAHGVALQSDGKVVTVGYFHNGSDDDFAVLRYNADGTLDTTFNATGIVTADFGSSDDVASGCAVQSDGKIIVVGTASTAGIWRFALARFHPDGTPDTEFGVAGTGRITTAIGNPNASTKAEGVKIQPDGKILVGGSADLGYSSDFVVLRYNSDGTLDNSFGAGGLVSTNIFGYANHTDIAFDLALRANGQILVGGYSTGPLRDGYAVAVYNSDGTPDGNFGTGGTLFSEEELNHVSCVAWQGDGKILVGGSRGGGTGQDFCLRRYSAAGIVDTTFGNNGVVITPIGTAADVPYDLAVQSDGKIVAIGASYNANTGFDDFAVARYNEDGSLDSTFRDTGKVTTSFPGGSSIARGIVIGPDGRMVVAGYAHDGAKNNFALARFFGTDQPPVAVTGDATGIVRTGAVLNGGVNSNNLATTAYFEYGLTSAYGSVTPDLDLGDGYLDVPATSVIGGLSDNTLYHFRIVATNVAGTTHGEDRTFMTAPDPPVSLTGEASNVNATSATLVGVALPNGRETTVYFEYGLTQAYGATTPAQILPAENTLVDIFAPLTELVSGATYHFRLVAVNAGSPIPINGEDKTFVAQPPPPVVSLGGVVPYTTTGVQFSGSVNASDGTTSVFFDYGTDENNLAASLAATPGSVTGTADVAVSAQLVGLPQGTTYYYRLRAENGGGEALSEVSSFRLDLISGLTQVSPGTAPEAQGFLLVNLSPSGLLHGWRFLGESLWRASGVPIGGLTTGDREIEFRPVPGFIHPPTETVAIVSGGSAEVLNRAYYETNTTGTGGVTVSLKPDSIAVGPDRAQWRLLGEDDSVWRDSGATLGALPAGSYLVECKAVTGRITPPNANLILIEGQNVAATLTYFLAGTATGEEPAALAFETVTGDTTKPYAWMGQIRSNVGLSTGFAVKERVVATAAHVVWDEGTLSAVEGLQWLHQRHGGSYEPAPQTPRGFYILSGYAAQRQAEGTPGTFSPESRNLDVAAMYFSEDAARGGYSGFLASDLDNNEFLLSNVNKLLVGYPVDGIPSGSQGRMHTTSPFDVTFTPVGATANRTFLTTEIRSSGGASGGPLCVQFEGGAYYPAGIYLGGDQQSLVRSIDSTVVDLFNRAELSGIDGQPHTGGGITHTEVTVIGGSSDAGALSVTLRPAAAAVSGGWRLKGPNSPYLESESQINGLNGGRSYVLQLLPVNGFQAPASQDVRINGGELKNLTFTYALEPAPNVEIEVTGDGRSISDSDATPSAADHTDFGEVDVASGDITRTFTITNTGTADLSVGSVEVSGAHPEDFVVTVLPGESVPPGGSTSFQVRFDPSGVGTRNATLSFTNNDSDENPFDFAIQGNETTDTDNNGFTDVEESGLLEILQSLTVGDSVDLDLSFLRLSGGQSLSLINLPPGLSFDSGTGRLSGTVTGKSDGGGTEVQKMAGTTVESSLPWNFEVYYPARIALSRVRPFPRTKVGKRSRPRTVVITNTGDRALTGIWMRSNGRASRDYKMTSPGLSGLESGEVTTFRITFRPRRKGNRRATVTVYSNVTPKTFRLSGRGK